MREDFVRELIRKSEILGISLEMRQAEQLYRYYEMLIEKNRVMNLTAITKEDEVLEKHFLDSLSIVKAVAPNQLRDESLIDVGTGAGFPGMVLKIAFPGLKVTLFDSLQKRLRFLEEVIKDLGLSDIHTVHGRAEDCGRDKAHREQYTYAVSRAVANMATLSEYCLPFVKTGGAFVAYKTADYQEELAKGEKAIVKLGGAVENAVSFTLPESGIGRGLLVIRKKKPTPSAYPRKAGLPSREPIQ